jgi:hypothetical protein
LSTVGFNNVLYVGKDLYLFVKVLEASRLGGARHVRAT